MRFFKLKKQKGITLVEFILVLAVFSLLTLGVYNLAANVTSTTTATAEAEKINTVIEKIERTVGVSGGFSDIDMTVFNQLTENYASNFDLTGVSPEFDRFTINYQNIPAKSCTKFVEKMLIKNDNVTVRVNDITLQPYTGVNIISQACTGNNNVSVILTNNNLATLTQMSTVNPEAITVPNSTPEWPVKYFSTSTLGTMLYNVSSRSEYNRTNNGTGF